MNELLPQLNRVDSGCYEWVQIYHLTRESDFMKRRDVRLEAVHRYRSEVENAGFRVITPCDVRVIAAQQLVRVRALITSPSGSEIRFEYAKAKENAA